MRFIIEYKDYRSGEETNRNLALLECYLNYNLIEKFHGWTFGCVLIRFLNSPKPSKKLKLKSLYKTFAEIEIISSFTTNSELSIEQFAESIEKVKEAVLLSDKITAKDSVRDYQVKALLKEIASLSIPASTEELIEMEGAFSDVRDVIQVKRVDGLMQAWKGHPIDHDKTLKGVRIYDKFEREDLSPFAYIYSELFSNLLRQENISTPGYEEVYFSIAESINTAKLELAMEEWHKYTYCTLDIDTFKLLSDEGKSDALFGSLKEGLLLISDFDHLDKQKIKRVLSYIEENGTATELVFSSRTKGNILAEIVFTIPKGHRIKTAYFLKITDINTSETGKVKINSIDSFSAPYALGKIQIKQNKIVIESRKSVRAEIYIESENLPEKYEFEIRDII